MVLVSSLISVVVKARLPL